MTKYIVGLGILAAVVIGYFLLVPAGNAPAPAPEVAAPPSEPEAAAPDSEAAAPAPEPVPAETAPVAPVAIASQDVAPLTPSDEALLEEMAADARENLPRAVTDTLTLMDALFLPRMRIMEYSYVTTAADARAAARDMRALIEARAETICLEGREMFGMGVTLRNSFEDREGNLFQRVYLLPEDCQQYY